MKRSDLKVVIKKILSEMFPGSEPDKWKAISGVNPFKVGDLVKLRPDVLQRHAKSIPAYMGYTTDQFSWRDTLRKLEGKIGKIERLFPDSKHVNVRFNSTLIGLNYTELLPVEKDLKEQLKKMIKEIIISQNNQNIQQMGDEQNNPFNDAAFAKNYRSTRDAFVTLVGDGGTTSEGLMEDVHAAVASNDHQALKDAIENFDKQIQTSVKYWNLFKSHLESKL